VTGWIRWRRLAERLVECVVSLHGTGVVPVAITPCQGRCLTRHPMNPGADNEMIASRSVILDGKMSFQYSKFVKK
jgi:hypothetical protein